MNRRVVLLVVFFLLTALGSFGSTKAHRAAHKMKKNASRLSAQNQLHFPAAKGPAKNRLDHAQNGVRSQALPPRSSQPHTTQTRASRVHRHANPPISQIGFVAASQIPAGGYLVGDGTLVGDFNGDGFPDVVSLAGNPAHPGNYSLAVVLSNGDGTFQPAVLTPMPGNSADPFVVGDVNEDGNDDIIVAHQPGFLPGTIGNPLSSFSVLLSNGDGAFTAGNNYSIADHQLSGGTLSLNTNGHLDAIFVDSATPGNVWTVQGNGDGTFSLSPTSATLSGPVGFDVVFADLNNDGFLDITANDNGSQQQVVFLAADATSFNPGVPLDTPDDIHDACSTTIGDLNGDGFADIANANCGDNTITIYVNDGSGGFSTGTYYNAATSNPVTQSFAFVYPVAVTIADVNSDGINDVISSNEDASDVTILLSNGDGTVQSPTFGNTAGGVLLSSAIVADFDGDGLADIIVPDDFYSLVYMRGYGDGTFRAARDYYSPSAGNGEPIGQDIATGDFNGDGFPDVVVGNVNDSTSGITVFLSRPDGSMQPGVNYGTGGDFAFVAVADFDQDGILDIAASNFSTGQIQIFHGNGANGVGDGTFTLGSAFATDSGSSGPEALVVGDFDQDGFPDIAVANFLTSNVGILLNDENGGFQDPTNYTTCSGATEITAADLNNDTFPDLLTPLPSCTGMAVLMNSGNSDGIFAPSVDFAVGNNPQYVAVGDLDGDGKVDLVITAQDFTTGQGLRVALGNGDGTFQPVNTVAYPTTLQPTFNQPYPNYVKLVDFDGDGNLDAVYTNENFGTVGVMYGVGNGTFFDPVEYPTAQQSFGLALADINQDGAVDVVTSGNLTSGVTTLLNNSGTKALPDYTVTADSTDQTITAGSSATFTFTVTPSNFYDGTITFSCGTLPSETTCTFNPPSLIPTGNIPVTATLTIHTTAASASLQMPSGINPNQGTPSLWASLSGLGVFGLMLAGDWRKKRNRRVAILLGLVALSMMIMLVGCGGSSNNSGGGGGGGNAGTPKGPHQIQVIATGTAGSNGGNTSAHSMNINVTVQ